MTNKIIKIILNLLESTLIITSGAGILILGTILITNNLKDYSFIINLICSFGVASLSVFITFLEVDYFKDKGEKVK
jgi:hypothetical protein